MSQDNLSMAQSENKIFCAALYGDKMFAPYAFYEFFFFPAGRPANVALTRNKFGLLNLHAQYLLAENHPREPPAQIFYLWQFRHISYFYLPPKIFNASRIFPLVFVSAGTFFRASRASFWE